MLGINYSGIMMLYSSCCGRAKKKMTDFVSENKSFLNEREKTLCKRGYYLVRASDRSWKKVKFRRTFRDKITEKSADFVGISHEFSGQTIGKKRRIWLFSGQISLEIDRFCADQTSIFNVFLTEVIICSFNNNTLQK